MSKEFNKTLKNALQTATSKTSYSEKEVFDEAIKFGLLTIISALYGIDNHLYGGWKIDKPFFNFKTETTFERLSEIVVVQELLEQHMSEAEPFDDVLSAIYQEHFISKKNSLGQFMTPKSLSEGVALMLIPDKDISGKKSLAEICCGTGSMTMAQLKNMYRKLGKYGLLEKTLMINDLDPFLLRIAVYQIMFHSFQHDVAIGRLDVICCNIITQYETRADHVVFSCRAKTEVERLLGFAKTAMHRQSIEKSAA